MEPNANKIEPDAPGDKQGDQRNSPLIVDRATLAREARDRQRAATRARIEQLQRLHGTTDPDELLRRVQAAATAAQETASGRPAATTGPDLSIAQAMPRAVRVIQGLAIENPKIWDADIRPVRRRLDYGRFIAKVRSRARARVQGVGNPLAAHIERIGDVLFHWTRKSGQGHARATFAQIARLAPCSVDVAVRSVRFLEREGLVDTFNVLYRAEPDENGVRTVRRAANLYLIRSDDTPPEPAGPMDMLATRLWRYAKAFRIAVRPWGYNATPTAATWRAAPA